MAQLTVNDKEVLAALKRLSERYTDLTPAMQEIAAEMVASIEDNFRLERAPDGTPWKPLSAGRVRQRRKREGAGRLPILNVHGLQGLSGSVTSDHGKTHALAGVAKEYGIFHQFGYTVTRTKAFGRPTKPYSVTLPARPIVGESPALNARIVELIEGHLSTVCSFPGQ